MRMQNVDLEVHYGFIQNLKRFVKERKNLLLLLVPVLLLTIFASYIQSDKLNLKGKADIATLNVKDFGAKGDGVTNDSAAFQTAINAQIAGGAVLVPPATYRVDSSIKMKNGVALSGYGAILYMPPKSSDTYLLDVNSTSGVKITGLKLRSDFVSPHSYIHGINAGNTGASDLVVQDIQTENLKAGMKLGTGGPSNRLTINNWTCRNDFQCLFLANVKGGTITNLDLSARTDATKLEHDIYLERLNSDLIFENIRMSGSVGYALQMYHSSGAENNSKRMTFRHLRLDSPNQGIVAVGYDDIKFEDLIGNATGSILPAGAFFIFKDITNLSVDGFEVAGTSPAFSVYSGATASNVSLTNGKFHQAKLIGYETSITSYTASSVYYDSSPFVMPPLAPFTSGTPTVVPTSAVTTVPTVFPTVIPTQGVTPIPTSIPTKIPTVIPTTTPSVSYGITVMATDTRRYRILGCQITSNISGFGAVTSYTKNSSTPITVTLTAPSKCNGRAFQSWSNGSTSKTITGSDLTANDGQQVYTAYYR